MWLVGWVRFPVDWLGLDRWSAVVMVCIGKGCRNMGHV